MLLDLDIILSELEQRKKCSMSLEDYNKIGKIRTAAFKILANYPTTLEFLGATDAEDRFTEDITRYNYKTRLEDEKTKFMKEFIEKQVDIGQIAKKLEIENTALRARLKAIRMVVNKDNDAKGDL